MLVVTELDDPFVPLPDDLLVNLKDRWVGAVPAYGMYGLDVRRAGLRYRANTCPWGASGADGAQGQAALVLVLVLAAPNAPAACPPALLPAPRPCAYSCSACRPMPHALALTSPPAPARCARLPPACPSARAPASLALPLPLSAAPW